MSGAGGDAAAGVVRAAIEPTFAAWRARARALLRAEVAPGRVLWTDGAQEALFGGVAPETCAEGQEAGPRVSGEFVGLAELAGYHSDPGRWALLYRVLYRLTHGEAGLLERATDVDVAQLRGRVQAVRRDEHKMHAFVRFRRTEDAGGEHFIAWYRPDHAIVPLAAPFFARRFAAMRWTILTPGASAHWDGEALHYGPGAPRSAAPEADELEDLFRTYYRNIFNPARLNLRAMRAEMPRKHWATLPEAGLIAELTREAPGRTAGMLAGPVSAAASVVPASRSLPVLRAAAEGCRACGIAACASRTVFGEGPARARLMLVGEQPGDHEDRSGRPFVGPAGQLLDSLLVEAGIDRSQAYLTNAVKHFKWTPGGKRRLHARPLASEVQACRAWLDAEIEAVQPALIVCLGSTAARSFLGPRFNAVRGRGQVQRTPWAPGWMATYHPSAALRAVEPAARERALAGLREDLARAATELARAG